MFRKLSYTLAILACSIPMAHAYDGEAGFRMVKSTGDIDGTSRQFFATGYFPLKNNISGELGAELQNSKIDGLGGSDASILSFGLFGSKDKVKFGARVNALTLEPDGTTQDDKGTRLDFDASITLNSGNLANVGISRFTIEGEKTTLLIGGMDFFPLPNNMLSVEAGYSSDETAIGARYLFTPSAKMGISVLFVHDRIEIGTIESNSNIFAVSGQYYFEKTKTTNVVNKFKNKTMFWSSLLR